MLHFAVIMCVNSVILQILYSASIVSPPTVAKFFYCKLCNYKIQNWATKMRWTETKGKKFNKSYPFFNFLWFPHHTLTCQSHTQSCP